jgi:hypothetical protein
MDYLNASRRLSPAVAGLFFAHCPDVLVTVACNQTETNESALLLMLGELREVIVGKAVLRKHRGDRGKGSGDNSVSALLTVQAVGDAQLCDYSLPGSAHALL